MDDGIRIARGAVLAALLLAAAAPRAAERSADLGDDVTGVRFGAQGSLEVRMGEAPGWRLRADDDEAIDAVRVQVRDGTLEIALQEERGDRWWWPFGGSSLADEEIHAVVVLAAVDHVSFGGAGELLVEDVSGSAFDLEVAGAGDCRVRRLRVERLGIDIAGAGDCMIDGAADHQEVSIAGVADYEALGLASRTADISVAGAGDARVAVSERLVASIAGVGDIDYRGDPEVSRSVAGFGSVKRID